MTHKYSEEEIEYLTNNAAGINNTELTRMFNEHFNLNLTVSQIKGFKGNRKINSGLNGRFKKGNVPYNKGKKGVGGWEPTQFKKGNKPHNYMSVGSERVNGESYLEIKIADPNKWKSKHILVWEEHNGPVPKGYAVIFGDGNKRNFDPNNLILVSRKQLLTMNRNKLIQNDADLTRTGVIIADLHGKINEAKRKSKK
jgi:hypothetical protein